MKKTNFVLLGNGFLASKDYQNAIKNYDMALSYETGIAKSLVANLQVIIRRCERYPNKSHIQNEIAHKANDLLKKILNKEISTFNGVSYNELNEYQIYCYNAIIKHEINWSQYFETNNHEFASSDAIIDYIINSRKQYPVIESFFDTEFYLETNPDIKNCDIDPLVHFLENGRHEGRLGIFNLNSVKKGNQLFDKNKKTVVIVSHETSATGAPLLVLNLCKSMLHEYNISIITMRKGNLHKEFFNYCFEMHENITGDHTTNAVAYLKYLTKKHHVSAVLLNSIVSYRVLFAAYKIGLPTLFLIHEFAEYMRPFGTMINAIIYSDIVVVPAKLIKKSILNEFKRFKDILPNSKNIYIAPQGKLPYFPESYGEDLNKNQLYTLFKIRDPYRNTKIVVGAGYAQIRKGLDLFVMTAKLVKKRYRGDFRFVWVGDGYDPDNDLNYAVYVKHEIENSGLGDSFVFLNHQKSLDNLFGICDIFYLPSRFDPFPNVLVDALSHNLHVVCFENGTGCADFLIENDANCSVTKLSDIDAAANRIVDYMERPLKNDTRNLQISSDVLSFDKYKNTICKCIGYSIENHKNFSSIVEELLLLDAIRLDFIHKPVPQDTDKLSIYKSYVSMCLRGIHDINPRPGFNSLKWIFDNKYSNDECLVPILDAIRSNIYATHRCLQVDKLVTSQISFVYAVHIHVFYIDVFETLLVYVSSLSGIFDLYITVTDEMFVNKIQNLCSGLDARNVYVSVVQNLGRDICPFVNLLKDDITADKYYVVGHFHTKKSLDLANKIGVINNNPQSLGRSQLINILETLIGSAKQANDLLGLFNEPKLGMIFVENSLNKGISENSLSVEAVCNDLGLNLVTETPIYPIGNMYWARVDAIDSLASLPDNYFSISEPIPYDGTVLHATERLMVNIVAQKNFEFATIYKKWSL